MERSFRLHDNQLQFRQVFQNTIDGVQLTTNEQEYLLSHFLLLLIGKPGSGKTTLLKQLMTNPQMYYQKFDHVLLISPSYAKMDVEINDQNTRSKFSLDWIFGRFDQINEEQKEKIYGSQQIKKQTATTKKDNNSFFQIKEQIGSKTNLFKDAGGRFDFQGATLKGLTQKAVPGQKSKDLEQQIKDEEEEMLMRERQVMFKDLQEMPYEIQKETHTNVLLVLDDVVGSIKKAEFDPRLAQLIMNRRHLIFNGTVSIIIVSQKYTMIPARVRSNANWIIFFQLNPNDLETIYRDAVILDGRQWKRLLEFTFEEGKERRDNRYIGNIDSEYQLMTSSNKFGNEKGGSIQEIVKSKKFENMGIWVESNIYFKNFKRIMM